MQIRVLEAKLEGNAGEGKKPPLVDGSSDTDSSMLFNGKAVLHEHCLSECRTQFPSAGGRDYLDEDLLSEVRHGSSFFSQQPVQSLYCYYTDDWDWLKLTNLLTVYKRAHHFYMEKNLEASETKLASRK